MFQNCKDTLHKGGAGLSRAIFEYHRMGYNVSIPLIDAQDYDLVVEKDNNFQSVQCKATSYKRRNYEVQLGTVKVNTKETKKVWDRIYDLLFVLCVNGDCYSIPHSKVPKKTITLGKKYEKYRIR